MNKVLFFYKLGYDMIKEAQESVREQRPILHSAISGGLAGAGVGTAAGVGSALIYKNIINKLTDVVNKYAPNLLDQAAMKKLSPSILKAGLLGGLTLGALGALKGTYTGATDYAADVMLSRKPRTLKERLFG
ncbi:MAG: hypothetical protein ABIM30_00360 [candidate division WOR-3 bacterium]